MESNKIRSAYQTLVINSKNRSNFEISGKSQKMYIVPLYLLLGINFRIKFRI